MTARALLAACSLSALNAFAQEHSCENPVVPAPGEGMSVVQAEQEWLRRTYGGGSVLRQALGSSPDGKRRYDLVFWRKPDGQTVSVCFDITTVFEETIRRMEEQETGDSRSPAR